MNVKNISLSPSPSPRGPPGQARANQLQPPDDTKSRGHRRTPQSSPSPTHSGERHLRSEGGADRGKSSSGQSSRTLRSFDSACAFPERSLVTIDRSPRAPRGEQGTRRLRAEGGLGLDASSTSWFRGAGTRLSQRERGSICRLLVVVLRSSLFEGLVTPWEALGPPGFLAPPPLFSVRVPPGFGALARQVPAVS